MNKIDITKKYCTRSKLPVEILKTDLKSKDFPVVAIIQESDTKEYMGLFTEYGEFYLHGESDMDLVEVSEWEDFKIDEPVMVRDHPERYLEESWQRRYFAGIIDGKPSAWAGGKTSWTAEGARMAWNKCRRPTPGELA